MQLWSYLAPFLRYGVWETVQDRLRHGDLLAENCKFFLPHSHLTPSLGWTLSIFWVNFLPPSLESPWTIRQWRFLDPSFRRFVFRNRVHNSCSRSSKVVDLSINRKRVRNFLLVISSNLGPTLPRFRDIAGFLLKTATPSLFHLNFVCVPLGVDRQFWASEEQFADLSYSCYSCCVHSAVYAN